MQGVDNGGEAGGLALPGRVRRTSLSLPEGLDYSRWEEIGHTLGSIEHALMFWIGDWMLHGEDHYGEAVYQAMTATGYEKGTIRNATWVARSVAPERRREDLSFAHHHSVAALDPEEQIRWLAWAAPEAEGGKPRLSSAQLRSELRAVREARRSQKALEESVTASEEPEGYDPAEDDEAPHRDTQGPLGSDDWQEYEIDYHGPDHGGWRPGAVEEMAEEEVRELARTELARREQVLVCPHCGEVIE